MSLESELVGLAATARLLKERGLVRANGGNVSLRWQNRFYISPRGAALDRLSAVDFVQMSTAGANQPWLTQRASSEQAMHLACYQARPDVNVVIHVHPPQCLALGNAGLALGAISPDFYLAVGAEVPLLEYITLATQELASAVGEAIVHHNALLLRNHGLVLVAPSTELAQERALFVEEAAGIVLMAHAATGTCSFLSPQQILDLNRAKEKPHQQETPP